MTLYTLLKRLELCDPEKIVTIGYGDIFPRFFNSWRGDYFCAGLNYDKSYMYKPKVKNLIAEIKDTIGNTFRGYKGGDFLMREDTQVYIDNYGEYSGEYQRLIGVVTENERIVLIIGK